MRNDRRRELTPRELHRLRRKQQIKRRRWTAVGALAVLIVIIIVLVTTCGGDDKTTTTTSPGSGDTTTTSLGAATFEATLTGTEAVPPVDTTATAEFTLTYDPEQEKLSFTLQPDGLDSPDSAFLYAGAEGENGEPIYNLYAPDTTSTGEFTGVLSRGDIDEAKLTGSLKDKTLADLIALIRSGGVYVAIGTKDNPTEAIRGQLSEAGGTDGSDTTLTGDDESTGTTAGDDESTSTTADDDADTTETTDEGN